MGLIIPEWMKPPGEVSHKRASKEISKISNPYKLKEIALEAQDREIALEACTRIKDQQVLFEMAIKLSTASDLSEPIIRMITDEGLLKDVALKSDVCGNGSLAVSYITNYDDLKEIALSANCQYARASALKNIHDQDMIESIARNDLNHYVREAALDRISDKELCQEIMNSWSIEQKANTQYELAKKENQNRKLTPKVKPGCCPHCGVRLSMPPQGIPSDSALYCSYCKKRIN